MLAIVVSLVGCSTERLLPPAATAVRGTATATTARWQPVLAAPADWRAVGSGQMLVESQALLRYRTTDRATLYSFWATYCPPCFAELPLLKALHARGDVAVISVSLDADQPELASTALGHHDVKHRSVVITQDGLPVVGDHLPGGIPFALLVDVDGQVVGSHSGLLDADELTRLLKAGHD